jgi:hypothetical protein
MDGTRFDVWTRRRFGLATGGALASLLGLSMLDDAEAKKNKHHKNKHNNKNKKKKCRKLGQSCDITNKNKKCCNSKQLCAQVQRLGSGNFCCNQRGDSCSNNDDCCGTDKCSNGKCAQSS